MANKINRGPAHLLQVVFQFPKAELEVVAAQLEGKEAALGMAIIFAEKPVIQKYYGIGCKPMTVPEIMKEFKITRSRVQTILKKGISKLQHPSRRYEVATKLKELGCAFTGLVEVVEESQSRYQRPIDLATELFGRDHAPGCTDEKQCPTCRWWVLLEKFGIRKQFDELLDEWLQLAKLEGGDVELDKLGLSFRSHTGLRDANLLTLEQITAQTEKDLRRIPNFGYKSLVEVKEMLAGYGRRLAD